MYEKFLPHIISRLVNFAIFCKLWPLYYFHAVQIADRLDILGIFC